MEFLGIASVPAITVIAYCFGMAVKESPVNDKWIPCIVGVLGGFLGVVGMIAMQEFPANDFITAAAVGIVSGLASTGVDQIKKQLTKKEVGE